MELESTFEGFLQCWGVKNWLFIQSFFQVMVSNMWDVFSPLFPGVKICDLTHIFGDALKPPARVYIP